MCDKNYKSGNRINSVHSNCSQYLKVLKLSKMELSNSPNTLKCKKTGNTLEMYLNRKTEANALKFRSRPKNDQNGDRIKSATPNCLKYLKAPKLSKKEFLNWPNTPNCKKGTNTFEMHMYEITEKMHTCTYLGKGGPKNYQQDERVKSVLICSKHLKYIQKK